MSVGKWKRWGAELRHHRTVAGIPQAKLAHDMHLGASTISNFEGGTRRPSRDHAVAADEALATGGALVQKWDEVHDEREIPEEWQTFEAVEARALAIREFQSALIPGLLQTEEYAREALRSGRIWDEDQIARLAAARASRLVNVGRCSLDFVLNEEALRRLHGPLEVRRRQLDHVQRLLDQHRIRVQVIPLSTLAHPNPGAAFRVLTLRDGRTIGQEEYLSGVNVVSGQRVSKLVTLFGHLQGEALSMHSSVELIDAIRKELSS